ncbi:MAG: hypothetical protein WD066_20175 [Planctomycetaceae bacterium]
MVFDNLNRRMLLIGGTMSGRGTLPTCVYDREKDECVKLDIEGLDRFGGADGHSVYDPQQALRGNDARRRLPSFPRCRLFDTAADHAAFGQVIAEPSPSAPSGSASGV